MSIHKLFIFGLPGSGKSDVAQHIHRKLQNDGWFVKHLYDYPLLQERFLAEIDNKIPEEERKFRAVGPKLLNGFDVVDLTVLDDVLMDLADEVNNISQDADTLPHKKSLLIIEFARKRYRNALSLFGNEMLQDAHILYIDSQLDVCIERIHHRLNSHSQFDHFVSDDTMKKHYSYDDWSDWCQYYLDELAESGIRTYRYLIKNVGLYKHLENEIVKFLETVLLRDTEPLSVVVKSPSPIESGK